MSLSQSFHSYDPRVDSHGLPHDPVKSCVIPRPIGWISSLGADGTPNLAPYSFFNLVSEGPFMVAIGSSGQKDTLTNIETENTHFVFNMATEDLTLAMNRSATTLPADVDEIDAAGLTPLASTTGDAPRIAESPIHLECVTHQVIDLPSYNEGKRNALVLGLVTKVHINQDVLVDGVIDVTRFRPISRMGYMQYATVGKEIFDLQRPTSLDDRPEIKAR